MQKRIEDEGKAAIQRKEQKIWFIDVDQGKLMKLHKDLDEAMPHSKGNPSKERCTILTEEIDLLWKKVSVYESYGNSERDLRIKAVEEMNKIKAKHRDGDDEPRKNPRQRMKNNLEGNL